MQYWKFPPTIKIYEALGCLADGRITHTPTGTLVKSSDYSKTYVVEYDAKTCAIMANDNGSYWQGYLGYPSIAVLLEEGVLSYDKDVSFLLKGIAWKSLNDRYKQDYDLVIAHVLQHIQESGGDILRITQYIQSIQEELKEKRIAKLGSRKKPPVLKKSQIV